MLFTRLDYHKMSDTELLERFRQRKDNRAVDHLFNRYLEKVMGTCLFYLEDKVESEDAQSQILIEILKRIRSEKEIADFESYLFIVSRNYCYRLIKKRASTKQKEANEVFSEIFMEKEEEATLQYIGSHPDERDQWIHPLYQLLDELSEEQCYCLELHYLEGLSYKEINSLTGFPLGNIKSYIQNGRRQLRKKLQA